jgi:hypothetical protein
LLLVEVVAEAGRVEVVVLVDTELQPVYQYLLVLLSQ